MIKYTEYTFLEFFFQGTLFHLPRFFVERQPKTLVLVGRVVEFLRSRHGGRASYDDLRNELQMGSAFKKLFKTQAVIYILTPKTRGVARG